MEFPTISASNSSLHLPVKSRRKPKSDAPTLHSQLHFPCDIDHIHAFASTLKEKRISVSAKCTENRNQASFDLENQYEKKKEKEQGWIHFVGVGGCGLSALAMLALKQGFEVSGSDIARSSFMGGLQEAGAKLHLGHSISNMQMNSGSRLPDAIVVSSAIPQDNVEILHAKSVGVPVYKRDYWLGKVTEQYNLIAVSGTHGKSTTASMLAYVLSAMGDDLTAIVGAHVPQFLDGNIILGGGDNFVLEADEYDGCFLGLSPYIAVVTNVDWEHVDIFQDEEAVKNTFRRFLKQIRVGGHLILCGDSEGACKLLSHTIQGTVPDDSDHMRFQRSKLSSDDYRITTYGISNFNEWHASSVFPNSQGGSDYVLCHRGCPVADISLQIPGVHNVLNSLAVIATVTALVSDRKQPYEAINSMKLHLNNFVGVSRRFEMIGRIYGCHIYDDYAHHPTEVRAVLQAARQRFPFRALLVVFQPHTFSRLAALMNDFATAFCDANQVVVTAIYAARETNVWNVSGRDLTTSIIGPTAEYIPCLGDVVDKLALEISMNPDRETVVLTLGAGDITTVGPKLLCALQQR